MLQNKLRRKKGAAMEWAIVFGFIIFALLLLITTIVFSFSVQVRYTKTQSRNARNLDQISEFFIQAVGQGRKFTDVQDTAELDAHNFFNLCEARGYSFEEQCAKKGSGGFDEIEYYRILTVKDRSSKTIMTLVVKEECGEDNSGTTRLEVAARFIGQGDVTKLGIGTLGTDMDSFLVERNQWHEACAGRLLDKYVVHFDVNDSKVAAIDPVTVTYENRSFVLPTPTASDAGMIFAGWTDGANTYLGGSTFSPSGYDANITLMAQWAIKRKLTLSPGSNGTLTIDGVSYSSETSIYVPDGASIRQDGDSFVVFGHTVQAIPDDTHAHGGWKVEPATEKITADKKITAKWVKASKVTVKSDGNGTVSADIIKNVAENSEFEADGNILTVTNNNNFVTATPNPGYVFDRWDGAVGKITDNMTVTARFVPAFTVTFVNDGMGMMDVTSITDVRIDSVVTVSGNKLTVNGQTVTATANPGYAFIEWDVVSGDSITADKKITAKFLKTFTVTLVSTDSDMGTVDTVSMTGIPQGAKVTVDGNKISFTYKVNGENVTKTATASAKPGYQFVGWDIGNVTITQNRTVTARWSAITYTVTIDPAGGKLTGEATYTYTISKSILPLEIGVCTRNGYDFKGWEFVTNSQGFASDLDGGTLLIPAGAYGNIAVRAKWEPIVYTIKFNQNGVFASDTDGKYGTINRSEYTIEDCESGLQVTITWKKDQRGNDVFRGGFNFIGWEISIDTNSKVLTAVDNKNKTWTLTLPSGTYGNITIKAIWEALPNVIELDQNGGSGASLEHNQYITDESEDHDVLVLGECRKDGYQFVEWELICESSASNASVVGNTLYIQSGTYGKLTLKAKWKAIIYEITDEDGNKQGEYSIKETSQTVTLKDPQKTGWIFDGWTVKSPSKVTVSGNTLTIPAHTFEAIELEAKWLKALAVRFDANKGDGAPAAITIAQGKLLTLPSAIPSRGGYDFAGWFTEKVGGTKIETGYQVNADMTCYAHWTAKSYTVTVDQIGGTGAKFTSKDYQTSEFVARFDLGSSTRRGYDFKGWVLKDAPAGVTLSGNVLTIPANVFGSFTVEAKWERSKYQITFKECSSAAMSYTYSENEQGFALEEPSKAGYVFNGWKITKNSDPQATISDGWNTLKISADTIGVIELTAEWLPAITVTFDANGGAVNPVSVTDGKGRSITLPTPTRNGYTFKGWFTGKTGGTKIEGTSLLLDSSRTLYAQWSVTVTYNANSSAGAPAAVTVNEGASVTLPSMTRTGLTFEGWFTAASGGTLIGKAGASYTPKDGSVTLYAHWSIDVTFDAKGGTTPDTKTVAEGTSFDLPTSSRSGFTFAGWYTSAGAKVNSNYKPTAHITLYAHWNVTVKYNANGGSVSSASATVEENGSVTLPEPTYTGYTFDGWYTQASGGTLVEKAGASYKPTSDVEIYAHWTIKYYEIKLDLPSGSGASLSSSSYTVNGTEITIKGSTTKTGYTFKGWTISENSQGKTSTLSGTKLTIPAGAHENITITAQWDINYYNITLDQDGGSGASLSGTTYTISGSNQTKVIQDTSTKTGYTFVKWVITSAPAGVTLDGKTLNIPANTVGNITIKAQWTINKYTIKVDTLDNASFSVKYDGKESTLSNNNDSVSVPYGTKVTITVDYTGNKNKSCTIKCSDGTTYTSGKEFSMPAGNIELTASSSSSCIASGTLITMADGTKKKIEDITIYDRVLAFNHETGMVEAADICFLEYDGWNDYEIINLVWSNGQTSRIIYEHGFFDLDLMQYVYIHEDDCEQYVGHRFYTGTLVDDVYTSGETTLVDAYVTKEYAGCYSFPTVYHLDFFMEDMLSMPGGIKGTFNIFAYDDDLRYNEKDMEESIAEFGLLEYETVAEYMDYDTFCTYPSKYLNVSIGKGIMTENDLYYLITRYAVRYADVKM